MQLSSSTPGTSSGMPILSTILILFPRDHPLAVYVFSKDIAFQEKGVLYQ